MSQPWCKAIESWRPDEILISFAVVDWDDDGNEVFGTVNLIDYIGNDCCKGKGHVLLFERRPEWCDFRDAKSQKDSRARLTAELGKACLVSGFKIFNNGWNPANSKCVYKCDRFDVFKKQITAPPSRQRKTTTSKPTSVELACSFTFSVWWSAKDKRWLMKSGFGCNRHANHAHMAPQELGCSTNLLTNGSNDRRKRGRNDGDDCDDMDGGGSVDNNETSSIGITDNGTQLEENVESGTDCPKAVMALESIGGSKEAWLQNDGFNNLLPVLSAITKITDSDYEAYTHVVTGMHTLWHEAAAIAAKNQTHKPPARNGMVSIRLDLETTRKCAHQKGIGSPHT